MKITEIMLDMDGVIVDFVRASLNYHKSDLKFTDVEWNFDKVVFPDNHNKFWESLGFQFWANLPWTPEGPEFFHKLRIMFPKDKIIFCTSPISTMGCADGKLSWIERYAPDMARQFIITPKKHIIAHPGLLLIDDNDPNCRLFKENGGEAILIPRPWNERRSETIEGNFNVQQILSEIQEIVQR